jgi:septal ring factor EnvC (AmiA/AmiB activator)
MNDDQENRLIVMKDNQVKNLLASLLVAAVGCLAFWAYDAQVRVDEYNAKVKSLEETIQAITAKQSADQESNLKDLEENKLVDDRVKVLEATVAEQQTKISELESKLTRKKK